MNPAFRSSSPQPSTFESHNDPQNDFSQSTGSNGRPRQTKVEEPTTTRGEQSGFRTSNHGSHPYQNIQPEDFPEVAHNDYPPDGMTQFCRIDPSSQNSSAVSANRPSSRDSHSEYSNPTSFSSQAPSLGTSSPTKQMGLTRDDDGADDVQKRKSGFFAPFRRKSKSEKEPVANARNTWGPSNTRSAGNLRNPRGVTDRQSASPEPTDPNTRYQLNVGNNVFDVSNPHSRGGPIHQAEDQDETDPIAKALADLKRLSKDGSTRMSADRYHGLATPAPGASSSSSSQNATPRARPNPMPDRTRPEAPPPSYNQAPVSRLGAPQPAFTSRQMQQTTQKYVDQKQSMFSSPPQYGSYDTTQRQSPQRPQPQQQTHRATSPAPHRSTSPRPAAYADRPPQGNLPRAASPNPYLNGNASAGSGSGSTGRPRAQSTSPTKHPSPGSYAGHANAKVSPNQRGPGAGGNGYRPVSPSPQPRYMADRPGGGGGGRAQGDMSMQLAPANGGYPPQQQQQQHQPRARTGGMRPVSQYGAPPPTATAPTASSMNGAHRARSKSAAGDVGVQYTREGRAILHFGEFVPFHFAFLGQQRREDAYLRPKLT